MRRVFDEVISPPSSTFHKTSSTYKAERALSNQDVRHRFVANFRLARRTMGRLLKGLDIQQHHTAQTGRPLPYSMALTRCDTNPGDRSRWARAAPIRTLGTS